MGGLSDLLDPTGGSAIGNLGMESITNPGKAIVDASQTSNPLQSFFDPWGVFSGLITKTPSVPGIPAMPSWATKYAPMTPTTQTNFGSFSTPGMQASPNSLHSALHVASAVPSVSMPVAATPVTPQSSGQGTGATALHPVPGLPGLTVVPGGPDAATQMQNARRGGGMQTSFNVDYGGDPGDRIMAKFDRAKQQYAQTPNTVVGQSSMTAPIIGRESYTPPPSTPGAPSFGRGSVLMRAQ